MDIKQRSIVKSDNTGDHGDGEQAPDFAHLIRGKLQEPGIARASL
jgi:hypothetical protein